MNLICGQPPHEKARPRISRGRARRTEGSGGLQLVQALGDRALAVRGLVLVDDALADGLVQRAGCAALRDGGLLDVPGLGGLTEPADGGLQGRAHRLVADTSLLVLQNALLLRLDVRHAKTCSSCCCCAPVDRPSYSRAAVP